MGREIITYVRIDGAVSTLVDVDNKIIAEVFEKIPVIYVTEQASHKLRLLHADGSPYSKAELDIYTGWDFAIAEDYDGGTVPPVRTLTGQTVVEETWTNTSGVELTGGVVLIPINANTSELATILGTEPYIYDQEDSPLGKKIFVGTELLGYIAPEVEPSLVVQYPFVFRNRRITSDTPPGTVGVDYLTPSQIEALYIPRYSSNVDTGALLNSDDYFPVWNKDTQLVEKYKISDIATGTQTPPVQNEYADIATMLANQVDQTENYLQQSGVDFYKKKSDSTADISDYDQIGAGDSNIPPVQNAYANTTAMIAGQGDQTSAYLQKAGTDYYEYLGTTVGDITDYQQVGGGGSVDYSLLGKSTGTINGLITTANVGLTTYSMTAGTGYVEDNRDTANIATPQIFELVSPLTNEVLGTIGSGQFTDLWLRSDGAIYEDLEGQATVGDLMPTPAGLNLSSTDDFYKQQVAVKLSRILHVDSATISTDADNTQPIALNHALESRYISQQRGAIIKGGKVTGISGLNINRAEYTYSLEGAGGNVTAKRGGNTAVTPVIPATQNPVRLYNYIDSTSDTGFAYTSPATVIDPEFWDDGASNTPVAVPTNNVTTQFVYLFNNGSMTFIYGRKLYSTIAEAEANLLVDFEDLEENHDLNLEGGVVTEAIILQQGFTNFLTEPEKYEIVRKTSAGFATVLQSVQPGFFNLLDSVFSFDNGTRTLTLTPTNDNFRFQVATGDVFEKSSPVDWVLPDTEGLKFAYFDNSGEPQVADAPNRQAQYELMIQFVSVSYIDWGNASFQKENAVTDIRKVSSGMSLNTTVKNFYDKQIYLLSGGSITDFPTSPDGSIDFDAQFGIGNGTTLFADRKFDFTAFSRGDTWRVLYKDGSNTRHIEKTGFPFLTEGDFGATTYDMPVFNNDGSPVSVDNNANNTTRYVWYFMTVTNSIENENTFFAWMGNQQYNNEDDADTGYASELNTVEGYGPILQEARVTYAVLYKTKRNYGNSHNCLALKYVEVKPEDIVGASGGSTPSGLIDGSNADNYHKHEVQALQASTSAVADTAGTAYVADGASAIEKHVITGNSKYLGTDSGGNRGVYDLPSGGGWGTETGIAGNQQLTSAHNGSLIYLDVSATAEYTVTFNTTDPANQDTVYFTNNNATYRMKLADDNGTRAWVEAKGTPTNIIKYVYSTVLSKWMIGTV